MQDVLVGLLMIGLLAALATGPVAFVTVLVQRSKLKRRFEELETRLDALGRRVATERVMAATVVPPEPGGSGEAHGRFAQPTRLARAKDGSRRTDALAARRVQAGETGQRGERGVRRSPTLSGVP